MARPDQPHICALDFADNLIEKSIDNGLRDARGDADERPRFRKELGDPLFWDVLP